MSSLCTNAVRSGGSAFYLRHRFDVATQRCLDLKERAQFETASRRIHGALAAISHIDQALNAHILRGKEGLASFLHRRTHLSYKLSYHIGPDDRRLRQYPFLTFDWLESLEETLLACAASLDWDSTLAHIMLLVRADAPVLALPFMRRAFDLLRAGAPTVESVLTRYIAFRPQWSTLTLEQRFRLENEVQLAIVCDVDRPMPQSKKK
jgi:hypothetical protein